MESTILHVIEAAGWRGDFVPDGAGDDAEAVRVALIGFALIEEPGRFAAQRRVVGLCGSGTEIVPVTDHVVPGHRFAGYSHRDAPGREVRLPDAIGSLDTEPGRG